MKKLPERQKKFMNYNDIRSILLLYESDMNERNAIITKIINELEKDGKEVIACGYVKKKKATTPFVTKSCMIDKSMLNFFYEPDKIFLAKLSENTYDLVLDLTLEPQIPLMYVLGYAAASLKAGRKTEAHHLLDFMIDCEALQDEESLQPTQEYSLFKEILFYLKNINSR